MKTSELWGKLITSPACGDGDYAARVKDGMIQIVSYQIISTPMGNGYDFGKSKYSYLKTDKDECPDTEWRNFHHHPGIIQQYFEREQGESND
jgi:hypothetical protein